MNEPYPEQIPIFPLYGTILLPNAILPLHIFEPRYRHMVEDTRLEHNLIGMVQPQSPDSIDLYEVGCLGKIEQFQKLPTGNYMIRLDGTVRFKIVEELIVDTLYRQARVSYEPYQQDLNPHPFDVDPAPIYQQLKSYLNQNDVKEIGWEKLQSIPIQYLINILCMNLDFNADEKQALLESPNLESRLQDLLTLLKMACQENSTTSHSLN